MFYTLNMRIIKCENLCMSYENKTVLSELSFNVERGDFLSIVGENGSGKSTLIRGILGLKKYKGVLELNVGRNQIGYLPQQTALAEDFPVTAGEIVLCGCLNDMGLFPFYKKKHRETAIDALKKMRVLELEKRRFCELSGGQKQRVLIARAICAAKELLLLDEPATGLDLAVRNELYELISSLNKNDGLTVVMISHDMEGVLANSDKILHVSAISKAAEAVNSDKTLENGSTKNKGGFFGTVAEYIKTPIFMEMGCNNVP